MCGDVWCRGYDSPPRIAKVLFGPAVHSAPVRSAQDVRKVAVIDGFWPKSKEPDMSSQGGRAGDHHQLNTSIEPAASERQIHA